MEEVDPEGTCFPYPASSVRHSFLLEFGWKVSSEKWSNEKTLNIGIISNEFRNGEQLARTLRITKFRSENLVPIAEVTNGYGKFGNWGRSIMAPVQRFGPHIQGCAFFVCVEYQFDRLKRKAQ